MARLTAAERAALPDRAFAYVDASGRRRLPMAVHTTARISATARGGEVLVSDDTRVACEGGFAGGFAFHGRGEHTLRGIPEPVRLFRVTGTDRRPPT